MRRPLLLLVLPALVAAAPVRAQDAPTEREYAVWSAVLDTRNGPPYVTRIVIVDSTRQGDRGLEAGPWPVGGGRVPDDAMQSFRVANSRPWALENRFRTRVPVQLLSQAGNRVVSKDPDDEEGRNITRFPGAGGVVTLSRVGFSGDGRTALVFHRVMCGGLCGEESYYLLALGADGTWEVAHKHVTAEY
jgi:hypothetical protein